jgi:hypothetical protein
MLSGQLEKIGDIKQTPFLTFACGRFSNDPLTQTSSITKVRFNGWRNIFHLFVEEWQCHIAKGHKYRDENNLWSIAVHPPPQSQD